MKVSRRIPAQIQPFFYGEMQSILHNKFINSYFRRCLRVDLTIDNRYTIPSFHGISMDLTMYSILGLPILGLVDKINWYM